MSSQKRRVFQDNMLKSASISRSDQRARAKRESDIGKFVDAGFINVSSLDDAVSKIETKLGSGSGFTLFTMNLDHLSKLKRYSTFRDLYNTATFVSADGWPVAILAGRGEVKISRTTGADLVAPVCAMAARTGLPLYLFGSTDAVLAKTASLLESRYPDLRIVGRLAPPFGFDPLSESALTYSKAIAESGAKLCFIALGAPTQEAFANVSKDICPETGFLCVGAALDFIAGTQHRAPKVFQNVGMEWAWRWALSPRRLGLRYIQCLCVLLEILVSRWAKAVSAKLSHKTLVGP